MLNHAFLSVGLDSYLYEFTLWKRLQTNCRLYMKDGNIPGMFGKIHSHRANCLEDMAVERFNNTNIGTSHVTGCE